VDWRRDSRTCARRPTHAAIAIVLICAIIIHFIIVIGWRRIFTRLYSSATAPIIVIIFIVICCLCILFGTPSHVVASPQQPYG
jgi:hypothetical protein